MFLICSIYGFNNKVHRQCSVPFKLDARWVAYVAGDPRVHVGFLTSLMGCLPARRPRVRAERTVPSKRTGPRVPDGLPMCPAPPTARCRQSTGWGTIIKVSILCRKVRMISLYNLRMLNNSHIYSCIIKLCIHTSDVLSV